MNESQTIEFIPPTFDTPFSTGVRIDDVLYLSGQIGMLPDGTLAEGFEAQARQTMDNIAGSLAAYGFGMDAVFKCTVMLDDMSRWQEFNKVYLEYFPATRLPARSAFGTDGLALGAHMEVECMAHTPRRSDERVRQ
ncbi:Rid family hydrolase [Nocardioides lijunqiniae]|uniref:Rid family hydrolase n=2 Tax=Nocardioides lijunqiniae TaxID=2760832 RepID=UPI0018780543